MSITELWYGGRVYETGLDWLQTAGPLTPVLLGFTGWSRAGWAGGRAMFTLRAADYNRL